MRFTRVESGVIQKPLAAEARDVPPDGGFSTRPMTRRVEESSLGRRRGEMEIQQPSSLAHGGAAEG